MLYPEHAGKVLGFWSMVLGCILMATGLIAGCIKRGDDDDI